MYQSCVKSALLGAVDLRHILVGFNSNCRLEDVFIKIRDLQSR